VKYTLELVKSKLPENVKIKPETYIDIRTNATFIDEEFGEWQATPTNVMRGSNHPQRALMNRKKLITIPAEQWEERLPPHLTLDKETFVNTKTICRLIDDKYGEFWINPCNITKKSLGHPDRIKQNLRDLRLDSIQVVQEKINERNPGITVIPETYIDSNHLATFIDPEYGEWQATLSNVLKGIRHPDGGYKRCQETWKTLHGVDHNTKIPGVARQMAKSRRSCYLEKHWETNVEVVCSGKLELAVVQYMNFHKIPFIWQVLFNMPDGRSYTIDLFLPERNTYVEIKGYFVRPANKEKWEWFLSENPTAELWTEARLRELGIITQKSHKFWKVGSRPFYAPKD
jgi:hypothetical protein